MKILGVRTCLEKIKSMLFVLKFRQEYFYLKPDIEELLHILSRRMEGYPLLYEKTSILRNTIIGIIDGCT